jgi:hypothetical protein
MYYSNNAYSLFRINSAVLDSGGAPFSDTTSLLYDGVDDYQDTSAWSTIDGLDEFTISAWMKFDNLSNFYMPIVGYETGTSQNLYWYVKTNGQLQVWSGGNSANWTRTNTGAITSGVWLHILMRLLPLSIEPNRYLRQRVFIDGVMNHNSSNYNGGTIPNGTSLSIGANPNNTNPVFFRGMNGNINEVAIWNTALTDPQILEVYNGGSANDLANLPTAPGPTNWYRSEHATWYPTGSGYYETADEMGNGAKLVTRNMAQASRVNDVP